VVMVGRERRVGCVAAGPGGYAAPG
jgi:hypothetical protein